MINFLHTHWIAYASAALIATLIWLVVVLVKRWKWSTEGLKSVKEIDRKRYYLEERVDNWVASVSLMYMPEDKIRERLKEMTENPLRFWKSSKSPLEAELKRREMMRQEGQKNE